MFVNYSPTLSYTAILYQIGGDVKIIRIKPPRIGNTPHGAKPYFSARAQYIHKPKEPLINMQNSPGKYGVVNSVFKLIENDDKPPVFMCIGSSGVAGDKLGPIVGELLRHKYNVRAFVYGTLSRPLTAVNLVGVHNFIRRNHTGAKIFAIDAALGKEEDRGKITVYARGLRPGSAVGKNLPDVGDYSITANVSAFGGNNIVSLLSAKENRVTALAETIAFGINDALVLKNACSKNFSAL
jgi:putative sporulation protein YyaC